MSTAPASPARQESERPERSRNAKAQARHRAKRKAYIEELEETVTKLQTALGQFAYEQHAGAPTVLPPPLEKIRQLEAENARLAKQNDELHHMLADLGRGRPPMPMPMSFDPNGNGNPNGNGRRSCDDDDAGGGREYKRRKMDPHGGEAPYLVQSRPGSSHAHQGHPHPHGHAPLPPLTVPHRDSNSPGGLHHHPHPHQHHYAPPLSIPSHNHNHNGHPVFGVLDPNLANEHGGSGSGSGGGGNGPALHLPDAPPPRSASASQYDRDHTSSTPVSAVYDARHEEAPYDRLSSTPDSAGHTAPSAGGLGGSGAGGGGAFALPPFKFNPLPLPEGHAHDGGGVGVGVGGSGASGNGSWRPYGDSERGA
ncbi:hypothetical protein B0H16DRAFT_415091 [Mycena metata]|uniref:BZIP domain-containing protein n=1 Tax=Mycena metata TaxID=1033252 RepID=A0AAD7NLI0_9AGAR|nr:hypothetical protein B0H16DRAFT_415091 [Mycena metata]